MSGPLGGNGQWGCPRHRGRDLRVIARHCNHSAFNGYRWTYSAYSEVRCFVEGCGHRWRTKAAYVDRLPNAPEDY